MKFKFFHTLLWEKSFFIIIISKSYTWIDDEFTWAKVEKTAETINQIYM
jgi:hypothetical protein